MAIFTSPVWPTIVEWLNDTIQGRFHFYKGVAGGMRTSRSSRYPLRYFASMTCETCDPEALGLRVLHPGGFVRPLLLALNVEMGLLVFPELSLSGRDHVR